MAIKAILFDLDNTLLDFSRFKKECCNSAIDAMISAGLRMPKGKALRILFELYDKYGIEYNRIFQKFLEKVKGKVDYRILAHGITAYRKRREKLMIPYRDVVPTLKKLGKRYKLAIISDAPRIKAWERLVASGLDKYFDAVITKGDVKVQKPSSKIFRKALKVLHAKPSEALMVGDKVGRDIKGAKALGIKSVFARYGNPSVKKSGADFEIRNIRELVEIVRKV